MRGRNALLWLVVLALLPGGAAARSAEEIWLGGGSVLQGERLQVTVTAVGDITIGADPRRTGAENGSQQQYQQAYVQNDGRMLREAETYFIRDDEITLVNLESSFTTSSLLKKKLKSYTFRAAPQYASILSQAGVEVVGHANNHAQDFIDGRKHTQKAVEEAGMAYVAGSEAAVIARGGLTVGFCAFNAVNALSLKKVRQVIKKLRGACDLVVASFHWGKEYQYRASEKMQKLGRLAVDLGADLVVGHHQHVVSGVERYKDRYIFYGLGTFSSVIKAPDDRDALLASVTFSVDEKSRQLLDTQVELVPYECSFDPDYNDGVPVKLTGEERTRVLDKVKECSQRFEDTLPEACFA